MVPRAIADVRRKFPNLLIDVDILKIEEAIDYLLLGKGEVVAMSHKLEHPMLTFEPLAQGAAHLHRPARSSAGTARAASPPTRSSNTP